MNFHFIFITLSQVDRESAWWTRIIIISILILPPTLCKELFVLCNRNTKCLLFCPCLHAACLFKGLFPLLFFRKITSNSHYFLMNSPGRRLSLKHLPFHWLRISISSPWPASNWICIKIYSTSTNINLRISAWNAAGGLYRCTFLYRNLLTLELRGRLGLLVHEGLLKLLSDLKLAAVIA